MRNQQSNVAHHVLTLSKALLLTFTLGFAVAAQTKSATDGSTPLGLQPGAPAGSYALSGFDNVNLYNGNLSFQLSLLGVSGRCGAQMPVMLPIAGKWRVSDVAIPQFGGGVIHRYLPIQSWWENNERKYTPGSMAGRQSGQNEVECPDGTKVFAYSITRLTFTAPDGTEYELRDQLSGGQPASNAGCNYLNPPSRGTVFITADGSAATFVSDTTIYDQPISPNPGEIYPSGYLLLSDGTRYRIDSGVVSWVRDRNGNKLTFTYDSFNRVSTITDSLKRQVTITYNTGPGTSDQISYKGFGGASRTILVNYASLANALRSDYASTLTPKALFPELNGSSTTQHNPTVVSSVTLPNGKQYLFKYNQYGELARVVLPTGGATEYDYGAGVSDYASGAFAGGYEGSWVVYRRVVERRLYPEGGTGSTYASRMTYSRPEFDGSCVDCVIAEQRNNAGTLLTRSKHYFFGSPRASFGISSIDYAGWKEGREYKTENFASNGTTILTRVVNTFQQRAAVSWWTGSVDLAPANDPRLSETTNTLVDTNQVSKQTFSYDDTVPFNNRADVYEYDFGSGAAGSLVRRTHTDYLKTNPVNSTDYTTTSIHIRRLPTQVQVFDASGVEKARTTFEYDNYVSDGNHALLEPRSNISGLDSGFTTSYVTRGNLTRSTSWILSTGTQLHSYNQFDVAGNVVKTIDARGYPTILEFADRYGAPDTEAQSNTAPSELGGQTSFAFATKVTNAANHIAYAQFDYYLGRPVNGEDANGVVASGSYNDSLDRPTQIKRAIGTGAENQSSFAYDDTNRVVTSTSDRDVNADNGLVSKVVYDGFGRTKETKQYEGGSNFILTEQRYDELGRSNQTSNPYRPYLSESAVWTTTAFDALSRVISVTTPDNAVVTTAYSGNAVTVTDQAGKVRRSITDGLGRLARVDEPDGNNNLDSGGSPVQPTYYSYDVLDDLIGVSQGVQTRTFVYDSLKRLTSATNPESGTVTYGYDANGNLTSKLDPRSITTTIAYDALNRVTTKSYDDNPQTPSVSYFYDAQTLPGGAPSFSRGSSTGRLVAVTYGSSSEGTYRGYDQMGRVVTQYQRTDSVNYLVEATYYANSSLHTETYPAVPGAGDRR
jgi:YD repeat-containing protein